MSPRFPRSWTRSSASLPSAASLWLERSGAARAASVGASASLRADGDFSSTTSGCASSRRRRRPPPAKRPTVRPRDPTPPSSGPALGASPRGRGGRRRPVREQIGRDVGRSGVEARRWSAPTHHAGLQRAQHLDRLLPGNLPRRAGLLVGMSEEQAFWTLAGVTETVVGADYFDPGLTDVNVDCAACLALLRRTKPRLMALFDRADVPLVGVLTGMLMTMWSGSFPLAVSACVWDCCFAVGFRPFSFALVHAFFDEVEAVLLPDASAAPTAGRTRRDSTGDGNGWEVLPTIEEAERADADEAEQEALCAEADIPSSGRSRRGACSRPRSTRAGGAPRDPRAGRGPATRNGSATAQVSATPGSAADPPRSGHGHGQLPKARRRGRARAAARAGHPRGRAAVGRAGGPAGGRGGACDLAPRPPAPPPADSTRRIEPCGPRSGRRPRGGGVCRRSRRIRARPPPPRRRRRRAPRSSPRGGACARPAPPGLDLRAPGPRPGGGGRPRGAPRRVSAHRGARRRFGPRAAVGPHAMSVGQGINVGARRWSGGWGEEEEERLPSRIARSLRGAAEGLAAAETRSGAFAETPRFCSLPQRLGALADAVERAAESARRTVSLAPSRPRGRRPRGGGALRGEAKAALLLARWSRLSQQTDALGGGDERAELSGSLQGRGAVENRLAERTAARWPAAAAPALRRGVGADARAAGLSGPRRGRARPTRGLASVGTPSGGKPSGTVAAAARVARDDGPLRPGAPGGRGLYGGRAAGPGGRGRAGGRAPADGRGAWPGPDVRGAGPCRRRSRCSRAWSAAASARWRRRGACEALELLERVGPRVRGLGRNRGRPRARPTAQRRQREGDPLGRVRAAGERGAPSPPKKAPPRRRARRRRRSAAPAARRRARPAPGGGADPRGGGAEGRAGGPVARGARGPGGRLCPEARAGAGGGARAGLGGGAGRARRERGRREAEQLRRLQARVAAFAGATGGRKARR